jgi:cell division protein FtsI/penicillin-binding protein 2
MVNRLLLIAAFIILPLLLLYHSGDETQESYYSPEHYVNHVNRFIKEGYLTADCMGKDAQIKTHFEKGSNKEAWYKESYLRADIERFNSSPDSYGWTFYIDDSCDLQHIHPSIHNFKLPFAEQNRWQGSIFYDGKSAGIALHSALRTIALPKVSEPGSIIQSYDKVGSSKSLSGNRVLLHFHGGRTRPAARFYYVGDKLIINNRSSNEGEVRLMGYQVPIGRIAWLKTGDWLYLGATMPRPATETFIFSAGETRPIASAIRQQNDKSQRFYPEDAMLGWYTDQTGGQSVPFFQVLARRMDRILDHLPPERAKSFDIQLSLRRDLQNHLNKAFHGECEKISRRFKSGSPFPAGITVMDGKSGKILAMSTYPWPEDLPEDIKATQRRNWLRNQNFVRHPIGSASKPFFYAAIMDTYPPLLGLEIEGYSAKRRHKKLLHCTLGSGYKLHSILPPGKKKKIRRFDLITALARSSNKYTVDLATLALAADKSTNLSGGNIRDWIPEDPNNSSWPAEERSGIWIKDQNLGYVPDITAYVDGKPPRCSTLIPHFEKVKFSEPLEQLTGVSTYLGKAPQNREQFYESYRTRQYDLRLWTPLISHLTQGLEDNQLWTVRSDFKGVSPERVNLAFNQLTLLRGDYITLLLGGGRGVWTNIQLAEAMSRLVTGRQVNPSLVSAILTEDGATGTSDEVPLVPFRNKDVRDKVLTGLREVVTSGTGTARKLNSRLKELEKRYPKDRLFLYSKTGSSNLDLHVPSASGKALETLVSKNSLLLKKGALHIRVGEKTHRYPSSDFNKGLSKLLQENGVLSRTERREISATLREVFTRFIENKTDFSWAKHAGLPDTIDSPLFLLGGQLKVNKKNELFSSDKVKSTGANYVFSLVKVPKEVMKASNRPPTVEEIAHPDTKVITIALHLEMGLASGIAVGVAKSLLKEIPFLDF